MKSDEKSFDCFRNLVIILVVLCYTVIHSMSLRWYVVSEQFNYTKNRVFHAILLPVFIEFSRCTGTYPSAKFELDIYSYEINAIHTSFWNYISEYNYNIDIEDSISHMYFFNDEKYVASLEVADYENYILIEEVDNQQNKLLLSREFALENIRLCFEGKADIDELLQEEIWKPLGKS